MKLYSYFRSSASYRVRIALNLKSLAYDIIPVHLLQNGGEQFSTEYRELNPNAVVPTLLDDSAGGISLTQSLAIIEYLDELYPHPPLLPSDAADKAYVRSVAMLIACDIHPLNNLRVLRYLSAELKVSEEGKNGWYRHWCEQGLKAVEAMLANDPRVGRFCYRDFPTLADCCLIPQVANAQRFQCDLSQMPTIMSINDACMTLDAFAQASPSQQPDAE